MKREKLRELSETKLEENRIYLVSNKESGAVHDLAVYNPDDFWCWRHWYDLNHSITYHIHEAMEWNCTLPNEIVDCIPAKLLLRGSKEYATYLGILEDKVCVLYEHKHMYGSTWEYKILNDMEEKIFKAMAAALFSHEDIHMGEICKNN